MQSPSRGSEGVFERIRFVISLGFRASPRQMMITLVITLIGAFASLVYPLAFRALVDALVEGDRTALAVGALIVGAFYALTWAAGIQLAVEGVSLVDRVGFHLSARCAELVSSTRGIEQFERRDYLQELDLVNQNRRTLASGPREFMLFLQVLTRSVGIIAILGTIDLRLALLAVFAAPAVVATRSSSRDIRRAEERSVEHVRRANDLFGLAVSAAPAKEVRVFGLADELRRRHAGEADDVVVATVAAAKRSAITGILGWGLYGSGFAGVMGLLVVLVREGSASPGDLLLAVTLIRQVQQQVSRITESSATVLEVLRLTTRLRWLEDFAAARTRPTRSARLPATLREGIVLEDVEFSYTSDSAGEGELVLRGVNAFLPAGATVALVGDNGAGKTTLVKLLTGMYEPTRGRILVDDVDLATVDTNELRTRFSAAFQDFLSLEFVARQSVGAGEVDRRDDVEAVLDAMRRAGTEDLLDDLPAGLDTPVGLSFPERRQLSGGQWQKLAVSRAMMRETPMLLVLDEPTASLDAAAEHALFERYAAESRRVRAATGAITLLVSHRFSTVRMADVIVVLARGTVAEAGSHDDLVEAGGLYSELFSLQARGYA